MCLVALDSSLGAPPSTTTAVGDDADVGGSRRESRVLARQKFDNFSLLTIFRPRSLLLDEPLTLLFILLFKNEAIAHE